MMIKTTRLSIRRVCAGDWKAIQTIWADAAKSIYAQYDKPNDLDNQSVSIRISKWASFADSDEHIFVAVCLQDVAIGYVSFNLRENCYEMGYCFHSDYHGKGYAKESILCVIAYLKSIGVHRLVAGTAMKNIPSVRLLNSVGFRQIGTENVSFYKDADGNEIYFDGGIFELQLNR